MPLSARLDGEPIYAFDLDDEAASALTARAKRGEVSLTMACERRAFLRVSKRGTRHFFHGRAAAPCTWEHAPMTEEHMAAQRIIIEAARAAGWNAVDEVAGGNDEDGRWRADVMATRGETRIAFEVQWSLQADYRYGERQEAYRRAGVRGAWFARDHGASNRSIFVPRADRPVFRLSGEQPFSVQLSDAPAIPLGDAVAALLDGRWRFKSASPAVTRARVIAALVKCFHCSKWMTVHAVDQFWDVPTCPDTAGQSVSRYRMLRGLPAQVEADIRNHPAIAAALRKAKLSPLAVIRPRNTKANADYSTHLYLCPRCDGVNASPAVEKTLSRFSMAPRAEVVLETAAKDMAVPHWCRTDHAQ